MPYPLRDSSRQAKDRPVNNNKLFTFVVFVIMPGETAVWGRSQQVNCGQINNRLSKSVFISI